MNKELDEMIVKIYLEQEGFTECVDDPDFEDQLNWIKDFAKSISKAILLWHDREKRKWALSCVGEIRERKGCYCSSKYCECGHIENGGYNTAKAEIRARLEEK